MQKSKFFMLISTALFFTSCKYGIHEGFYRSNPVEKRSAKLTTLDACEHGVNISEQEVYSFLVISDVHFGAPDKRFDEAFIEQVISDNTTPLPSFCICLGDVAEHGLESEYADFNATIADGLWKYGIKTFCVVGNHDLYNSGWENYVVYNFPYSSSYKMEVGDLSFYFIDSASGTLGYPQIENLKTSFATDSKRKMIFSHVPLYADDTLYFVMQDSEERNDLITLFAENNVSYFSGGHIHKTLSTDFGSFVENNVPAYLDQKGWAIYTVNQSSGQIDYRIVYLQK